MTDDSASTDRDIRHYLRTLRRRKWAVAVVALVVTAAAVALSVVQTPIYQATANLLIQEPATTANSSVFSQTNQAQTNVSVLVGTQIEIVTSRPVRDAVAKQLGSAPPVSVAEVGQTEVVAVRGSSTNPARAAQVANAWSNAYISFTRTQDINSDVATAAQIQSQVTNLQKQIDAIDAQVAAAAPTDKATVEANLGPQRDNLVTQQGIFAQDLDELQVNSSLRTGAAQLVTPAQAPTSPSSPKPTRNALLGLGVGLLLGVSLAFVLEGFDECVTSLNDLDESSHGLPNLALIPQVTAWKARDEARVVSIDEPRSAAAEAYRTLRTAIQFVGLDHAARIIQITSPNATEGKTTSLANLGVALANAGQRVCLCCCDLRRPRIHEFFSLDNTVGLTSVILGETSLSSAIKSVPGTDNLSLLASGPQPPNPSELLASHRAGEVIAALATLFDVVLLDCPPVLPVTDAAVLSGVADATLLVVTAGVTARREVTRAVQVLEQVHAPLIGTVLNGVTAETGGGYYRYSQYKPYGHYPTDAARPKAETISEPNGVKAGALPTVGAKS